MDRPNQLLTQPIRVVAIAAAIGGLVVATYLVSRGGSTPDEPARSAAVVATTQPASVTPKVVMDALASQHIILQPSTEASSASVSPERAATAVAKDGIGSSTPTSVALARLSTPKMGQENQMDPSKPSQLSPMYTDRLVWVVTVDGVPNPEYGGMGSGSNPDGSPTTPKADQTGTMAAFVDAKTGDVLFSVVF